MAAKTKIEWCDSTLNLSMGCNGCELWNPKAGVKRCYAGTLTDRYGGTNKGFPESFDKPKLFLDRIMLAQSWSDLTGVERPEKPWLNHLPRVIFLGDMGDTFTEDLPWDWFAEPMAALADTPHVYILLTKRPERMAAFSQTYRIPDNIWPATSVTSATTAGRLRDLLQVNGGGRLMVSAEPLWGPVRFDLWSGGFDRKLDWVIYGGESGADPKPMNLNWLEVGLGQCISAGILPFVKQLGKRPYHCHEEHDGDLSCFGDDCPDQPVVKDKGNDMSAWPEHLRVREVPNVA